jgi:hypothetical protein
MESKSNNANSAVLALNGLRFKSPQPLSTTILRTSKKQYSQRQSYDPGDTIVFHINSTGFIDPEQSFLKLTIQAIGANAGFGAVGSAMNLIRNVRISSKNGTELDRIQSANEYSVYRTNYSIDKEELKANSLLTGYQTGNTGVLAASTTTFCIPMSWVSGLFRPHVKGQMIPPHLISGARFELELETFGRALFSAGATTGYVITNPQIVFMESTLNDNSLKVLTEESAQNGLEYTYDRVFSIIEANTTGSVSQQINKAVSQATSVFVSVHATAGQNAVATDSFLSVAQATNFGSYLFRLGSNYFPHQVVNETKEAYLLSRAAFKNDLTGSVSTVSYADWSTGGLIQVGTSLKTHSDISSSGLAVNNSAAVEVQYEAGTAAGRTFYIFMTYTALARAFLQQVSCKI